MQNKFEKFSPAVCKQLDYYVYRLVDPRNGQTFYIGKGKNNRVFQHANGKLLSRKSKSEDSISLKLSTIKEIIDAGLDVIHIIHRWGLDEQTAFEVEAALIDAYPGLTNIQSGHSSDRGTCNCQELEKLLGLSEYVEPTKFKYLIIKTKQTQIDYVIENEGASIQNARYEATRKYWHLKPKDISNYPYVLSVSNGVVYDVYEIEEWIENKNINRWEFVGHLASDDIRSNFINKKIPKRYRKRGMASPYVWSN